MSESTLRDLVERMLQSSGRRVDISQPFVDASMPDCSRLHVAITDVLQTRLRHAEVLRDQTDRGFAPTRDRDDIVPDSLANAFGMLTMLP